MVAMVLEQQGKVPEAEKEYQRVLSVESNAAVAANNLAWLYVSSNRKLDEALQLAQTALQQLPDEPNIHDTLGWIYYRKNMAAAAIPASRAQHPDLAVRSGLQVSSRDGAGADRRLEQGA